MIWVRIAILVLGLQLGGWLAYDGTRALVRGDYVTPKSGDYAGQLGPWANLARAVGIEPRSTLMKCIHIILGAAWIVTVACFVIRLSWSKPAVITCAILSLWYLPFGTLIGIVTLILIAILPRRCPSMG